eukprot:scaffold72708_cov66-Phaeocystis_antarctica.AAC.2
MCLRPSTATTRRRAAAPGVVDSGAWPGRTRQGLPARSSSSLLYVLWLCLLCHAPLSITPWRAPAPLTQVV